MGFFYVHRSACRFIYEIVEVYLRKQIRLSFLGILFAQG
nr:MAG TPA: hypothetical protein [Caudoviricetes sp.]